MTKIFITLFLLITASFAQKFEYDIKAKSVHLQDGILYIKTKKKKYKQILFKEGQIEIADFTPPKKEKRPRRILRDGLVTKSDKNIKQAWLYKQTLDYDHEILGDNIEAKAIALLLQNDKKVTYSLDENHVFEDRKIRLYDINGDGQEEMFVIKTHLEKGASLAMFEVKDEKITQTATTGYLNRSYRWLNVVGFSDLNGNGKQNIALIKTPHIGGILTIYEFEKNALKEIYSRYGFTNHYIGSRELDMSAVADFDDDKMDEMVLVDMKAKKIKIVSFKNNKYKELKTINNDSKINSAIIITDLDNDGYKEIIYTLRNKKLIIYTYKFEKKSK